MAILKVFLLVLTALIAVEISKVESACCRTNWFSGLCLDDTNGTPYCGYGSCNWLGCSCKGGCRGKRNLETRAETVAKLKTLFKELDTDDDNELTKSEVVSSGIVSKNKVDASVAETDLDGDGKIALHEFEKLA